MACLIALLPHQLAPLLVGFFFSGRAFKSSRLLRYMESAAPVRGFSPS